MRWLFRHFWLPIYRRWALQYIRQERIFRYGNLSLRVPPAVFHPGIFFSTPVFLRFLEKVDFQNKKTLDVGTGSGVLALFAAQKGAQAYALDINLKAVETARSNAQRNNLLLQVWHSNLFNEIPVEQFDYILVNPPYYPRDPKGDWEHAFFAGSDLVYFEKLFSQLPDYLNPESVVWVILSEDCDLETIQKIAGGAGFELTLVYNKRKWGERFFVLEILKVETESMGQFST